MSKMKERIARAQRREFAVLIGAECDKKDKWMSVMKEDICLDRDREGDEEN